MSDKNTNQGQINIELDEQTAEGIYSNLAIINHSNTEFVLDFVSIMPGVIAKSKGKIKNCAYATTCETTDACFGREYPQV